MYSIHRALQQNLKLPKAGYDRWPWEQTWKAKAFKEDGWDF